MLFNATSDIIDICYCRVGHLDILARLWLGIAYPIKVDVLFKFSADHRLDIRLRVLLLGKVR